MSLVTACVSHSPLLGINAAGTGVEAVVREAFAVMAKRIASYDPELIILLAPDHFNGFFYDLMPQFCIGARACSIGDYGSPAGELDVPTDLANQCAQTLIDDGFAPRFRIACK